MMRAACLHSVRCGCSGVRSGAVWGPSPPDASGVCCSALGHLPAVLPHTLPQGSPQPGRVGSGPLLPAASHLPRSTTV